MKIQTEKDVDQLNFEKGNGLIPVIIQDRDLKDVRMLGYANKESLHKSISTGKMTFFSRSKGRLWTKGESSGNELEVISIVADCDRDTLLVTAEAKGPTCHTGDRTCFHGQQLKPDFLSILQQTIEVRKSHETGGSYTASLFENGIEAIAQKVGEEATETVIAALAQSDEALLNESADLMYHLMVLLSARNLKLEQVVETLSSRHSG